MEGVGAQDPNGRVLVHEKHVKSDENSQASQRNPDWSLRQWMMAQFQKLLAC